MSLFVHLTVVCVYWISFEYGGAKGSRNLMGYYEEDLIALPKTEIYSTGMTVSKCVIVCGQEIKYFIALKGEWCRCSATWTTTVQLHNSCEQPVPCPGDPSEICGCGNQMAYYNAEYLGQCTLSFVQGKHVKASSQSKITVQLYGDSGECFEASVPGTSIGSMKNAGSNCFDLGKIRSIRVGNTDPSDGYQINKVIIETPKNQISPTIPHVRYEFIYDNWIGTETTPTGSIGSQYRVVDIFHNGTANGLKFSYPEIDGGLFYKNFSIAASKVLRCALKDLTTGCGGKENTTYVKFEAIFYKRIIDLPQLVINDRKGCDNPPLPNFENVTINFKASKEEMSVPKNTNVNYTCKIGNFIATGTPILTITCNSAGYWITTYAFNQLCVLNCKVQGPKVSEGATSNRTDSSGYGTVFQYACSPGFVFGGTLESTLTVACQANGKWSMSTLPPCIPFPKKLPAPIITSELRPMSTYHGQVYLDQLKKNGTTFTIRPVN